MSVTVAGVGCAPPLVTLSPAPSMEGSHAQQRLGDLARAARTCDTATEALLARVRQLALRYSRARLSRFGAEDAAQDVAQEVCLAVFTGLAAYDERGVPFEAFVYSVASRKVADAQRVLVRGPVPLADLPDAADGSPGPEAAAVARDEADRAWAYIQQLPVRHQEILTLRVAVGMSTEETAAALDMTPGAIRVAQHRALARLRCLLTRLPDRELAS